MPGKSKPPRIAQSVAVRFLISLRRLVQELQLQVETMRNSLLMLALASLSLGCASEQLNYNTLDLAATVDSLVTKQVLENLSKFIDNPSAIPSQVDLAAGSATTANSITPTFADPFSGALTTTKTLSTLAAATKSTTTTNTSARATSPMTFGVSALDQWTQSWTIAPVTAPDDLRRLRALYRYVFHGKDDILKSEYPLVQATKSVKVTIPGDAVGCPMGQTFDKDTNKYVPFSKDCEETISVPYDDPSFLRQPGAFYVPRLRQRNCTP